VTLESANKRRLDSHLGEFTSLVETARRHVQRDRLEAAAAWSQVAAHYAWMNHTGLFGSPDVEDILRQLGARLPQTGAIPRRAARPREVLHVVTQCYGTGGSTQEIACWVEQDQGRHHRVCVTRQRGAPPPDKVLAPLASPSDLIRLDTGRGGLMERAGRLRALAMDADVVVLHVHPYDVVPVIAFAGAPDTPPVVLVDHADHVFWLGTSVSSVVMHMRDSGRRLAAARRGLDPARSTVVPRPLRPAGRTVDRDDAKRRLGIDPAAVLLVTAADGSKYRPVGSPSFVELALPVLERHQNALLHAAGPSPEGEWQTAAERTGGRIRALGMLPDVRLLQEAADVYLDSFPFASLTSLLEAGSLGVPAITYRGHPEECAVFGADTRGVDEHMLSPSDPIEFGRALGELITDAGRRQELGRRTERAIRETHTGDGWLAAADGLYALAAEVPPPSGELVVERRVGRLDVLVDLVMNQTGFAQGMPGALRDHLALLPVRERVAAWRRLTRAGARPPHRNMVPDWLLASLWRYRQLSRQAGHTVGRVPSAASRQHA
jgi:glycosyltransferase involved in cell wall biosynthesis